MTADTTPQRAALPLHDIFPQIGQIADHALRTQVEAVWQDLWTQSRWNSFDDLPTSKEIPYPARPHSQCVLDLSLATVERDWRFAKAWLHDYVTTGTTGA